MARYLGKAESLIHESENVRTKRRTWWIALYLAISFLLGAYAFARKLEWDFVYAHVGDYRTRCRSKLYHMGIALRLHERERQGRLPESLDPIHGEYSVRLEGFRCPHSPIAEDPRSGHLEAHYIYKGKGPDSR